MSPMPHHFKTEEMIDEIIEGMKKRPPLKIETAQDCYNAGIVTTTRNSSLESRRTRAQDFCEESF